ncbi:hypothetical protein Droror1_Dr00025425, partial [Drosera rotundifolia]
MPQLINSWCGSLLDDAGDVGGSDIRNKLRAVSVWFLGSIIVSLDTWVLRQHMLLSNALFSCIPNVVILGKKAVASKLALINLKKKICDGVQCRARQDKYRGVALPPEELIESVLE